MSPPLAGLLTGACRTVVRGGENVEHAFLLVVSLLAGVGLLALSFFLETFSISGNSLGWNILYVSVEYEVVIC